MMEQFFHTGRHPGLSRREREVLALLLAGNSKKQIADHLRISERHPTALRPLYRWVERQYLQGVDAFIYYATMGLGMKEQKRSLELFCSEVIPAFA